MRKPSVVCPLCENMQDLSEIAGPDQRVYYECGNCRLIFTAPDSLPSVEAEEKRYLQHNNGLHHRGYLKFLSRAVDAAEPFLFKGAIGLDYGCGPSPSLSVLLKRHGVDCADYDPIFFPEQPAGPFDFVFATECFEHFFSPAEELVNLNQLLRPGGFLVVMTSLWNSQKAFRNWSYARDYTHVSFYHAKTFNYICSHFGFRLAGGDRKRLIILQKV
ncbi:class I SAM-dependent methyltransferase [Sunxiuqinia dokdonensis]|uniref:Uncharacterized protein n=1 Tax=Sunxiuqinia dokdonensis TaxID=1409788 RepID=A0A0L8V7U8_9BACT|nr:class I SAM-dependent methyltransferase [Sunxiuqinia dokdonensis]KOH44257.1 hypothetical protein NC99_29280 [Sunxiuqinia dokdonensis]